MDERLLIAARSLGGAERCLDVAFAYATERRQFGSRIFDYQAVSFQLADCAVELQAARAMTYQVAWEIDRKQVDAKTLHAKSASVKLFASQMANRVADRCVQVLGGRGYMRENPVERLYRDLRVDRIWEGTDEIQKLIVANELVEARARRPLRLAGIRAAGLMSRISLETLRREQLLDAAIGLVASKGYEATTVRDIAAAADVATGTIAYWFDSRDDLLRAALVEAARRFGRRLDDALAAATTPLDELIAHAGWRRRGRRPRSRRRSSGSSSGGRRNATPSCARCTSGCTTRGGRGSPPASGRGSRPARSAPSTPTTGRGGSWPWPTGSRCTCSCTPARSPPTTWSASRASTSPPHCWVSQPGRFATLPLHLGGFIGPFGGAVLAVLVPELRDAFDATTAQIALAVPAYLVPFALLQVVSGTLGERLGRRRTVQAAYLAYALASVATALAPTIGVFLVGRAFQGVANAFTTPLLMAALADVVPRERLGRSIGTFAGVQAAGISFAPLLGGLAAEVSWRLAFFAPAVVSLALMLVPPKDPVAVPARGRR